MSCLPIANLSLDDKSIATLERIKQKKNIARLMSSAISVGIFNSIFTKSQASVAAFNITQTDWDLYSKAMAALPTIQKQLIKKEIDHMILHYQMGKFDYKHVQFWRGLKDGCQ